MGRCCWWLSRRWGVNSGASPWWETSSSFRGFWFIGLWSRFQSLWWLFGFREFPGNGRAWMIPFYCSTEDSIDCFCRIRSWGISYSHRRRVIDWLGYRDFGNRSDSGAAVSFSIVTFLSDCLFLAIICSWDRCFERGWYKVIGEVYISLFSVNAVWLCTLLS